MQPLKIMDAQGLQSKFQQWYDAVVVLHDDFEYAPNERVYFTPLSKPLSACRVALVTSAGVHRRGQPPFDMVNPHGDWSCRPIEGDVFGTELMVTHDHYNHEAADHDINCVFPIDRIRELAASGEIGEVSPLHFGLMGFIPRPGELIRDTAPYISRELVRAGVDVAIFTPG